MKRMFSAVLAAVLTATSLSVGVSAESVATLTLDENGTATIRRDECTAQEQNCDDESGIALLSSFTIETQYTSYVTQGDFTYGIWQNVYAAILSCDKSVTHAEIPSKIGDYPVQHIEVGAFADCTELESVTLPETLYTIGSYAFKNCKKLKSLSFPENFRAVGGDAFEGCDSLTDIYTPSIEA